MADLVHAYLTVPEFRDLARDQLTAFDGEYQRSILSASRQIDSYCGRQFWLDSATTRLFRPTLFDEVWTGDIGSASGIIVKTDDDDDGVFETTWASTDYQLEPFERMNNRPYERIVALGSAEFPLPDWRFASGASSRVARISRRARVQITAQWGWPVVPDEVKQACAILAVDHFKAKDLTNIASQYGTGTRFARDLSGAQFGRGERFVRLRSAPLSPEAEALLQPLRVVVVA